MRTWRLSMVCLLALLSVACHEKITKDKLSKIADEFVPPDALDKSLAPLIPWVQISFKVHRPALQFDDSKISHAQKHGWMTCRPQTDAWAGYVDTQGVPPGRYVQMRSYMLYRQGVVIAVVAQYSNESEAAAVKKGAPASEAPAQNGMIIAGSSTEQQFRDRAASQGLVCGN